MALTNAFAGVSGLATTTDLRKALAGIVVTDETGAPRPGIFPRHSNALLTARTDMNVNVGAFEAAAVQFGGPILFANESVAQLPAPLVSPGAGTNYYVVYAKINENTSPGTDPNNNRVLGTVLSTSSFTTARASGTRMDGSGTGLPTGAVEIGTVEMPTGKTATNQSGVIIINTFQCTAAAGGVVRCRNQSEEDAWAPANGNVIFRLDLARYKRRIGGAWVFELRPPIVGTTLLGGTPPADADFREVSGIASVNTVASGDANIVYPSAFPNGVIAAHLQRRDFTTYGVTTEVLNVTQTLSQLNFRIYNSSGAALASVSGVPYVYRVIGW